jgi:hypothetical protein
MKFARAIDDKWGHIFYPYQKEVIGASNTMRYMSLEAMVPGWIGEHSVSEIVDNKEIFKKVHYVFDDYPSDCIVERSGVYLITQELKKALEDMETTGCEFDDVIVSESDEYEEHTSHIQDNSLPKFYWLKIIGKAGKDDIGRVEPAISIVVSERVFNVIRKFGLKDCIVYAWLNTSKIGTHISKIW